MYHIIGATISSVLSFLSFNYLFYVLFSTDQLCSAMRRRMLQARIISWHIEKSLHYFFCGNKKRHSLLLRYSLENTFVKSRDNRHYHFNFELSNCTAYLECRASVHFSSTSIHFGFWQNYSQSSDCYDLYMGRYFG